MKRTNLLVALAGAATLLAGCSSNSSGTPTAASTSSSTAESSVSSLSSESSESSGLSVSSELSVGSQTSSSGADSSGSVASSSMSSDGGSGGSVTEGTTSAEDSSSAMTSATGSSGSDTSSSVAASTAGDTKGSLDEQSTAWFTAFCDSAKPLVAEIKSASSLGSASDPATAKKGIVELYSGLGKTMTDIASSVKDLPPPTFPGGDAFASKAIKVFGELGPKLTATGKEIQAEPVDKIPSSVQGLSKDLGTISGAMELTPQTQAAIKKIPACAALSG